MSYSPLGPLPIKESQIPLSKKQARIVDCPDDTISDMLDCLKTVSHEKLGDSLDQFAVSIFAATVNIK